MVIGKCSGVTLSFHTAHFKEVNGDKDHWPASHSSSIIALISAVPSKKSDLASDLIFWWGRRSK